jgi:hypothetical protein
MDQMELAFRIAVLISNIIMVFVSVSKIIF